MEIANELEIGAFVCGASHERLGSGYNGICSITIRDYQMKKADSARSINKTAQQLEETHHEGSP